MAQNLKTAMCGVDGSGDGGRSSHVPFVGPRPRRSSTASPHRRAVLPAGDQSLAVTARRWSGQLIHSPASAVRRQSDRGLLGRRRADCSAPPRALRTLRASGWPTGSALLYAGSRFLVAHRATLATTVRRNWTRNSYPRSVNDTTAQEYVGYLRYYDGRVRSGKHNVTVWRPSVSPSVWLSRLHTHRELPAGNMRHSLQPILVVLFTPSHFEFRGTRKSSKFTRDAQAWHLSLFNVTEIYHEYTPTAYTSR